MWPKREIAGVLSSRACKLGSASRISGSHASSVAAILLVEECAQTPAHLSPIIFRVFLSSEAQYPSRSPPFAFLLFPASLSAAGVDALSPCETSYTCAWKVVGGDM